jgi:methylmalonyl-CoA carboxyltransferase large subunit
VNDLAHDDTIRALREELARLSERVAALEAAASRAPAPSAAAREGPSEAVLAILSAAIAAYLGKKPRLKSVRVLSSPEWGRQGRLHIQASHALER